MNYSFKAGLWLYPGGGAWVFITLPAKISKEIKDVTQNFPRKGFGSIKISVAVNNCEWKTSIFPDSKSNSYLLPIKKVIRDKTGLKPGDTGLFTIRIDELY